jgi:hypothetical protein
MPVFGSRKIARRPNVQPLCFGMEIESLNADIQGKN